MLAHVARWSHDALHVWVRHSRSAPFSGTCYYRRNRIYVNVGRSVRYPHDVATHIARARGVGGTWRRELYRIELQDAYQLALFVFLHEFYHWLVSRARRNPRQKEARCDRFAVACLVDHHGAVVRDYHGAPVSRDEWDFQDLIAFVSRAPEGRENLGRTGS